jgi:RecA/RadA recombinase
MAKPKKTAASFKNRLETTFKTMPSDTLRVGFSTIDLWCGVGNYAMNRINSGRFDRMLLFGRNYVFYGESGSGKSLNAAWVCADAQKRHNALVLWIDVEKATDSDTGRKWLQRAGIDMENCIYVSCAGLEEIKRTIAETCKMVRDACEGEDADPASIQPVVIIVDSWAAAQTEKQLERTEKGELVGDQGQKAKQTGEVILSTTHLCSGIPVLVVGMQHIYDNQDGFGRAHKTSGGNKMIYYASGCMLLTKKELRVEHVDNAEYKIKYKELDSGMTEELKKKMGKDGATVGITCIMENLKSRVAKPFQKVEIQIPYLYGLDPYSGLFELLQQEGAIRVPSSGWYEYSDPTTKDGAVKFRKADFRQHADRIMALCPEDISDPSPPVHEPSIESEQTEEVAA